MSLKDHFQPKSKERFFDEFIDMIENYGFGSMLKSDQDALLYHLLAKHITPGVIKNRHSWVEMLRVKPSRLNGVQELASVKFNLVKDDSFNWLLVSRQLDGHPPEVQDLTSGKVIVYIDDAHIYRFLEWFLNEQGSSPEYVLNKTQLVLKYDLYLLILEKINDKVGLDVEKLKKKLKEDKSSKKITKTYNSAGDLLKDVKERMKETTIKEGTKELLAYASTAVITYAKKKLE
ncbi:hypothetical protein [Bizionia arctica]|uniref:Uncharacterized protein n=1 Tax=Bizionia arctica TaxID=1495645 RepID=A0A917LS03_9FLAO|nr:hypothetical protein [Bizionia arctica]GGG52221.1 hypothetical protein GCM10010976_24220 [Bizionia arctica]